MVHRAFVVCIISAMLMYGLWCLPEPWQNALQFDHLKVQQGEWWRLFTGNFTHFTLYHVSMNALGLMAMVYFLWPPKRFALFVIALLGIPLCVGLGLYLIASDIDIYRGYSGALYGVLAVCLLLNLKNEPLWMGGGLLVLAVKIGFEQTAWYDDNTFTAQIGAAVATDAHLYGVLAGVVIFMADWALQRVKPDRAVA